MRRSLLFIPGNNPSMLQNSDVFEADSIIIDLEDAVNISEKDSARNLVKSYLDSKNDIISEMIIRINGMDTNYYLDDLKMVVSDKIDCIMLPKANSSDLVKLDQILTDLEGKNHLTKSIKIIPIVELASSLLEINAIATSPRVDGILLGAEDFTSDMEVSRTKEGKEISYARSVIAVTSMANKIDPIDTPFTDVNDAQGLEEDIKNSISLGMKAKAAIHPNQIEAINRLYAPTVEQIAWANKIIEAKKIAFEKGLGAFSVDGKMVDKPVIERAEKILKKAKEFNL